MIWTETKAYTYSHRNLPRRHHPEKLTGNYCLFRFNCWKSRHLLRQGLIVYKHEAKSQVINYWGRALSTSNLHNTFTNFHRKCVVVQENTHHFPSSLLQYSVPTSSKHYENKHKIYTSVAKEIFCYVSMSVITRAIKFLLLYIRRQTVPVRTTWRTHGGTGAVNKQHSLLNRWERSVPPPGSDSWELHADRGLHQKEKSTKWWSA